MTSVDTQNHSYFIYKNYTLNDLDNTLYNMYSLIKSVKALREALDRKYKVEYTGMKKVIVNEFLDFKIIDSRNIISQVQEF